MNRGKSEHVLLIERELGSPIRAEGNLRINNLSSTAGKQCLMEEEKIFLASMAWQYLHVCHIIVTTITVN
jgi:hypothetical protein